MRANVGSFKYRAGMMRSVSMSLPRTTMARPETLVILESLLIVLSILCEILAHVDDFAAQRGGGDHRRAHQQCPAARAPLPADEVADGRRRADLAPLQPVGIHRETHRAARLAPLEAGGGEDFVQPFFFRQRLDLGRPGHDERADTRCDSFPLRDLRRRAEVA